MPRIHKQPPSIAALPAHTRLLGIDVGGTKMAAGLVDPKTGVLSHRQELPTLADRGGDAVLDDAVRLAREMLAVAQDNGFSCPAMGMGVCELVDVQGNVLSGHTVAWNGLPVQARLRDLGPAVVESDVRAHALAEAYYGAGREYTLFALINVGTGISSTIVEDRRALAGARGNALVLASSPLVIPYDETGATTNFVLEEYASGTAMLRRYADATGAQLAHGRELVTRAATGDAMAEEILASSGAALGNTLAFLVNIVDPEALVVGGGLGMAGGLYFERMVRACREAIYADATRVLPIVQAQLGVDAGIIGAALSALKEL